MPVLQLCNYLVLIILEKVQLYYILLGGNLSDATCRASNGLLPSSVFCVIFMRLYVVFWYGALVENLTTSDSGSLGSHIDEERSKLQYIVI